MDQIKVGAFLKDLRQEIIFRDSKRIYKPQKLSVAVNIYL